MKIERFENIEAWQLGRKLTKHETKESIQEIWKTMNRERVRKGQAMVEYVIIMALLLASFAIFVVFRQTFDEYQ